MSPETTPSETELEQEKEKDKEERRRIIIALLFLLLSFSCIFCSSQSALWLIDRSRIGASMLSGQRADYGGDVSLALAPLEGDIAAEAEHDEALLLLTQTPMAGGLGVVILPNPLPTPAPTVIALLPTPTPTPTVSEPPESGPSTPPPSVPTSTSVAPPPTSPPPTSPPPTSPPPTSPPPTAPPPTVPPTSPPPTAPPPTSPPPTAPPPTSPPPTAPPPTATATPTAIATATATPTPTDTATATPTATPTNTPTPPIMVQFESGSYSLGEANPTAPITVTLSAASGLTVTVNYTTSGITAMAGLDYLDSGGTLTFTPGITSQTFLVTILDETPPALDEPDETVELRLVNPINDATFGTPAIATLAIVDDDLPAVDCLDVRPPGEPDLIPPGSPDADRLEDPPSTFARVGCGLTLTIALLTPINIPHPGFDLVYYEVQGANPDPVPPEQIYMDWVVIEVGQSPSGPWHRVFYWGDAITDINTNIGQAGYGPPEADNTLIPMTTPILYGTAPYTTGIAIDIDGVAPAGTYQYVRIYSPPGGPDGYGPEVDAIEVLP